MNYIIGITPEYYYIYVKLHFHIGTQFDFICNFLIFLAFSASDISMELKIKLSQISTTFCVNLQNFNLLDKDNFFQFKFLC